MVSVSGKFMVQDFVRISFLEGDTEYKVSHYVVEISQQGERFWRSNEKLKSSSN